MNAGSIVVTVDADYSTLSKKVGEAKRVAEQSGKEMGKGASAGFGSTFSKGVMEQLKGVSLAIIGVQAAQGFLKGFASTIRGDKDVAQAYVDFVKALPIVGALAEVVEASFDRIQGIAEARTQGLAADPAVQEMRRKAALERSPEAMDARRNAALAQSRDIELQRLRLVAQTSSNLESQRKAAIEIESLARDTARAEYERSVAAAKTDEEKRAASDLFELRQRQGEEELASNLARIRKEQDAKIAAERAAAEEREIAYIEAATEEFRFEMAKRKEIMRVEDESLAARIQAQQAGLGAISTFAGQFRFDAYPQDAKRRNDERMVSELKGIRERIAVGGFA
jgi:hypothetical protein